MSESGKGAQARVSAWELARMGGGRRAQERGQRGPLRASMLPPQRAARGVCRADTAP